MTVVELEQIATATIISREIYENWLFACISQVDSHEDSCSTISAINCRQLFVNSTLTEL